MAFKVYNFLALGGDREKVSFKIEAEANSSYLKR
jgi:hypothetical protein